MSIHDNLKMASKYVKYAHGQQVSNRDYRIKFKIISYMDLKKIKHTGGVVKSKETKWYKKDTLILLNNKDRKVAEFKCIEQYKHGEWTVL
ncbi:hypothetical protein [Clostridium ljungdahlii]|uniref:hypothetical protein n=1 Tax=Clostridium ljungdahlii TaxID=1538 RepID=UPI0038681FF7